MTSRPVRVALTLGLVVGLAACVATPVTVSGSAPALRAVQPTMAIGVGQEKDLLPFIRIAGTGAVPFIPLTWEVSNPTLLSIDPATGRARGIKAGSVAVQVKAPGNEAGATQLIIEVVGEGAAVVKDVQVQPSSHHMAVGETVKLPAQVFMPDGQINANVAWASSDDTVATVNRTNGEVSALRPGRVTILAAYAPNPEFKGIADLFVYATRADIPASPEPVLPTPSPQASSVTPAVGSVSTRPVLPAEVAITPPPPPETGWPTLPPVTPTSGPTLFTPTPVPSVIALPAPTLLPTESPQAPVVSIPSPAPASPPPPTIVPTPTPTPPAASPTPRGPLQVFRGHTAAVVAQAFSPDGKLAASASYDSTVKIWDVSSGNLVRSLVGHVGHAMGVAFSPDGTKLASGGSDGVRLWDVSTGQPIRSFIGHQGGAYGVVFSPDGRLLASAGPQDSTVRLWNIESGELLKTLIGHSNGSVESVAFTPNGRQLVSAGFNGTLRVWDVTTGDSIRVIAGHQDVIQWVAVHPAGSMCASASYDSTVKLWKLATGELARTLQVPGGSIMGVAFSPDGEMLATGAGDKMTRIWNVTTGAEVRALTGHAGMVNGVVFNHDGTKILSSSSDKSLMLWDVSTAF